MNAQIDFKSVLLGLLLGLTITIGIAATSNPNPLPGPVGRFQVESSESFVIIIDTVTGKAWSTLNNKTVNRDTFFDPKIP